MGSSFYTEDFGQPFQLIAAQPHHSFENFVSQMLDRVNPILSAPQVICVCPNKELAKQNEEYLLKMDKYIGLTSECAVFNDNANSAFIRRQPVTKQFIIGTPGRIKRLMSWGHFSMGNMRILVFDKADKMLAAQEGGLDDALRIIKGTEESQDGCQLFILLFEPNGEWMVTMLDKVIFGWAFHILLFSETLDDNVKEFITKGSTIKKKFAKKVVMKTIVRVKFPNEFSKVELLHKIFARVAKPCPTIIFVKARETASMLHENLNSKGHKCTSIYGDVMPEERDRLIKEFKSGVTEILISNYLLANNFLQGQVNLVVNFELCYSQYGPRYEVYKGVVFNFLSAKEDELTMSEIERHLQRKVPEVPWENDQALETVLKDAGLAGLYYKGQ